MGRLEGETKQAEDIDHVISVTENCRKIDVSVRCLFTRLHNLVIYSVTLRNAIRELKKISMSRRRSLTSGKPAVTG